MRARRWVHCRRRPSSSSSATRRCWCRSSGSTYALPILLPFEISPLAAAALGISLNSAAFSAEIYRGGIESIERGQAEAARALGMTRGAGDAPHHPAAGAAAHAARAHQPRHRDLQDDDARLGGGLRRAAAAGQAARLAELQPDRDLHRDRRRLLPVPLSAGAGDLRARAAARTGRTHDDRGHRGAADARARAREELRRARRAARHRPRRRCPATASPSSAPRARARARCCAASTSWRCRAPASSSSPARRSAAPRRARPIRAGAATTKPS